MSGPVDTSRVARLAEYQKRYRQEHRDQLREQRCRPERRVVALLAMAKRRAEEKGIEFAIVASDLGTPPTECPLLGTPIRYGWRGVGGPRDDSPSIDRIDPRRGYVPGNVWIICNRANRIKGDGTAREHLLIALAMAGRVANVVGHGKRDLERALRDAGLSSSLSKRLIATGFTALREAAADRQEIAAVGT